LKPMTVV